MSSAGDRADGELEDSPQPTAHNNQGVTRREAMRRGAGAAAAAGVLATGAASMAPTAAADDDSSFYEDGVRPWMTGEAVYRARPGWLQRYYEAIGAETVSEGLSVDVMSQEIYRTLRKRQSTNRSTVTDNWNIKRMMSQNLYSKGKIAAIEAINDEESQSDVESAAQEAVYDQADTVLQNLARTWNEAINELLNNMYRFFDHPDTPDIFDIDHESDTTNGVIELLWDSDDFEEDEDDSYYEDGMSSNTRWVHHEDDDPFDPRYDEYETPWGSEIEVVLFECAPETPCDVGGACGSNDEIALSPFKRDGGDYMNSDTIALQVSLDEEVTDWDEEGVNDTSGSLSRNFLAFGEWVPVIEAIEDTTTDVADDLILWVDEVYGDVQSGDLDTGELLAPTELAELTAEEEENPRAIADLIALGASVNPDRVATVEIPEVGLELTGPIAATGDTTISTDDVIDPEDSDEHFFITVGPEDVSGTWNHYDEAVDGGVLTFTEEPFDDGTTVYEVTTVEDETVHLDADDFEEDDEEDEWTVDLSDDLEDAVTEVESIEFYPGEDFDGDTLSLQEEFEVTELTDADGEEVDESTYEPTSELQDDTNYITQSEWEAWREEYEEQNEAYDDDSGGGGIDIGLPSFGGWDDLESSPLGLGILALVALAVIGIVTDLVPGLGD